MRAPFRVYFWQESPDLHFARVLKRTRIQTDPCSHDCPLEFQHPGTTTTSTVCENNCSTHTVWWARPWNRPCTGNGSHTHRLRHQSAAAMQTMTRDCHPSGCPALMQAASRGVAEESLSSLSKPLESETMRDLSYFNFFFNLGVFIKE